MARYRAIAADLAAKIRDGHYAPGEALPAQRELSAAYGVTLMTLRQALRELGAEGLIVQRPGKGTFVAPPHLAYQLGSLRSLADDLREQGHEVRTTVIAARSAACPRASRRGCGSARPRPGCGWSGSAHSPAAARFTRSPGYASRTRTGCVTWISPPRRCTRPWPTWGSSWPGHPRRSGRRYSARTWPGT